jgi:exopolyphosphatase / guanosine-5'-triphosphate,3'-diphosphate pyrophosphatase
MIYGAIDIGTNAARLLIGEVADVHPYKEVKKISYTRIPLRLGMDVFETGHISDPKKEEFLKTLQAFKLISEVFHVEELRVCATSAMREAANGNQVRAEIKRKLGLEVEVISGEEEATLIFESFFSVAKNRTKPFIVADLGGGSLEISIFEKGQKMKSRSFNVGTIRTLKGMVTKKHWDEVNQWLKANIKSNKNYDLFATGGNVNKMHKVFGLKHMQPLQTKELKKFYNDLKKLSIDERIHKYDLKEDRADVIVPACDVYLRLCKALKISSMIVPKIGLSDGIILDLYNKKKHNGFTTTPH